MVFINIKPTVRVGLFGAISIILGSISAFHFSKSKEKTPAFIPEVYGNNNSQMHVTIMGTDINHPWEDFSKKFNEYTAHVDEERNEDYTVAGWADAAGSLAALVSALIEAANIGERPQNKASAETNEPDGHRNGGGCPKNDGNHPDHEADAAKKDDEPSHDVTPV